MNAPLTDRLWDGLRLAVIDVETAVDAEGHHRIVSIALVSCRRGIPNGHWHTFVDPGIPIDPVTSRIHGLTDSHVADAPSFGDIAPVVLSTLTPAAGETLVVCAHHVRFDVPVLRAELARIGSDLANLPLLDTSGGLLRVADVHPPKRRLAGLLEHLGIPNSQPHDALADASATAKAACELLRLAAARGYDDLGPVLADAADGTAHAIEYAGPPSRERQVSRPPINDEHLATHAVVLGPKPGKRALAAFVNAIAACVSLRCGLLADRVAAAQAPSSTLLAVLLPFLEATAQGGDAAATATLLGAMLPLLRCLEAEAPGHQQRRAALALEARLAVVLDPLARCPEASPCPSCWEGLPCPLDAWRLALAPAALGGALERFAPGFLETNGQGAGTGVFTEWRRQGRGALADVALRVVYRYWLDIGQRARAEQLAQFGWDAGCHDPQIAEAYAVALARGGREPDLRAALDVCETALPERRGSTDDAWSSLALRAAQLDGRLERGRVRYTGELDEDGNPVPVRPHHPTTPKRTRPARFMRGGAA